MKRLLVLGLTTLVLTSITFAADFKVRITRGDRTKPATKAVIVFLSTDGLQQARSITGDHGLTSIRDLPAGTYLVRISYRHINKEYPTVLVRPDTLGYHFDIDTGRYEEY